VQRRRGKREEEGGNQAMVGCMRSDLGSRDVDKEKRREVRKVIEERVAEYSILVIRMCSVMEGIGLNQRGRNSRNVDEWRPINFPHRVI
jgi:hypothetical protein